MAVFQEKLRQNVTDLFPQINELSNGTDRHWDQLYKDLAKLSVARLRERYPAEWNCYRGMRGREKTVGAVIAPAFRSFNGFLRSVGPCPAPGYTIDRVHTSDPEYAPGKVRWASKVTQANNRANTVMLIGPKGRVRPITEWAKLTNQNHDTLRKRHQRGWTDQEIISGKRNHGGVAVNRATTGKWPSIVERPGELEKAWQTWIKQNGYRSMTRNAFFVWMATNIQRGRLDRLQRRFPDQIGDGADPRACPCPPLTDDAVFQQYARVGPVISEIQRDLSVEERLQLEQLYRSEPPLITVGDVLNRVADRRAAARL